MEDFAIKIENVSKTFKLPREKTNSIKSAFVNFYRRDKSYDMQKALSDVSLEIKKGEFFGVVGRNGSGKSTLLKLLAGIYTPTKGQVHIRGALTPFIELGVGFNPELTGRENVYLNGALLGFNRKEMQAMYKDIVSFAELERFMDQKLKNYSSGMQVRLAFSIAIRARSDILLIDEVLAVGDGAFQRKCYDYFNQLKAENKTVILVSHDMDAVQRFCSRAALITRGKLSYVGATDKVAALYDKQNESDKALSEAEVEIVKSGAEISELMIENKKDAYEMDDSIKLRISIKLNKPAKTIIGLHIMTGDGQIAAGLTSQFEIKPEILKPDKTYSYEYTFSTGQLAGGNYTIDGIVYEFDSAQPLFYKQSMASFKTIGEKRGWGAMTLKGTWNRAK